MGIQCENKIIFIGAWQEWITGASLGPKHNKNLRWDTFILHTKPSLYGCRNVQRFQIFKQNQIIPIFSRFIAFLLIWDPLDLAEVVGGWGSMWWNCKWPTSWVSCLACLTFMGPCLLTTKSMCLCPYAPYIPY